MTPKGYTNRQQIENYLLTTIDPSFYNQINDWIAQMEIHIDKMTGRNFVADGTASEKVYDGDGSFDLFIDDAVEVEEVKIDDEILIVDDSGNADDYYLYPANELPKRRIKTVSQRFNKGNQNISVSAKWGYSASAPYDIGFAVTILVAGIINYSGDMEGEIKSMSIGRYSVTYKDEKQWQDFERIKDIIKSYKRMGTF